MIPRLVVPRLVFGAPSSGAGKTTVATGLMAALRARGLAVSPHKVGPDYIDPGYHALAAGRPGRNLDPLLLGESRVVPAFLHGARGADVAVVEGVMGLYDGRGSGTCGSTAHVAQALLAPVVLVVDASAQSRSVAALVHGFATYDRRVRLAAVVLNRVGSERHERLLREALDDLGVPVAGVLRRAIDLGVPSRHLGLVPAAERAEEAVAVVERLGRRVAESCDLDALLALARSAPPLPATPLPADHGVGARDTPRGVSSNSMIGADPGARPVVAVFGGPAFTFAYAETEELLTAAGARVVRVDPLRDASLPPGTAGLVVGGGFPEVHVDALAANAALRADVAALARSGAPVSAECAGLLYLGTELEGRPMCGVLPTRGRMTGELALGYRDAEPLAPSWMGTAAVVGHEHHRTRVEPRAGAEQHGAGPAWRLPDGPEGFVQGGVHASYLHVHWAGVDGVAERFVAAARSAQEAVPCAS